MAPLAAHFRTALQEAGRSREECEISLKVRLRFGDGPTSQPPLHGSPQEVIDTIVLGFTPETIGNVLGTLERFVREVRPALG